jgi:hypothetical protein
MSLLRIAAGLWTVGALAVGCGGDRVDCNCPAAPRGCVYTGREGCACAAMVCSDVGPLIDRGSAVVDAGGDASIDQPTDADDGGITLLDRPPVDVGADLGVMDVTVDASRPDGAGVDAPRDEAGLLMCPPAPTDRACSRDDECVLGVYQLNCVGERRAVAFHQRAMGEFVVIRACWALAAAEVLRCPDRLSRGTEVGQTGGFVRDPALIEPSCRGGQCAADVR